MDRALLRLYAATFLYAFAMALGIPLVPQFLKLDFGASVGFIGLVMGVYGLMQIFLRLPMGDMADRRGRRRSLLIAFACSGVAGLLFVFARGPLWIVPAVGFFGFAGGIYWVAANSYLFDRAESSGEGVARATSDYSVAVGLAFLAGPPIGGLVAADFGFRAAFVLFLASSVLGALFVMTLPEAPRVERARPEGSPYRRAWRLLRHRALVLSAIGTFLYSALFATINTFFPVYVNDVGFETRILGVVFGPVALVGLLLGGRQASATLVRVGLPRLLTRLGPARVLFGGVVAAAVATFAVPLAGSLSGLLLAVLLFGAATGVMIPANLMLVHEGAPADARGLANGIYGTMLGIGSAVAPVGLGFLGASLGLAWAFWGAAATSLLGVIVLAAFLTRERREAPGSAIEA